MTDVSIKGYEVLTYTQQRIDTAKFDGIILDEVKEDTYPNLYRRLNGYGRSMYYKLSFILRYLEDDTNACFYYDDTETGEKIPCTAIPYKRLVGLYGGSRQTWEKCINFCLSCGMLSKHNPNVEDKYHNTYIDEQAREYASKERGRRRIRHKKNLSCQVYYHLPSWSAEILSRAEENARRPIGTTLTNYIDRYGKGNAQRYLDTKRGIPKDTIRARERIDKFVLRKIDEQGYCTRSDILRAVHVYKSKQDEGRKTVDIKRVLSDYTKELTRRYNLSYARPTAKQKSEYLLSNDKWIYSRR